MQAPRKATSLAVITKAASTTRAAEAELHLLACLQSCPKSCFARSCPLYLLGLQAKPWLMRW